MKIQIKSTLNLQAKTDCLVVALKPLKNLASQCSELNKATGGMIKQLQDKQLFTAYSNQLINLTLPSGIAATQLLLAGVGSDKTVDNQTVNEFCVALANKLKALKVNTVTLDLTALVNIADAQTVARHLTEALGDAEYRYQKIPKAAYDNAVKSEFNATMVMTDRKQLTQAKTGAAKGLAIHNGKTLAKNLGNMPGNVCTPKFLAQQAKKLGRSHQLKTTVLNEKDMAELGMGSLLSVSRGSRQPAKLIVMSYNGADSSKKEGKKDTKQAPHVLVGKGLTFDAGGISLKPSVKMDEMKYDMCGAASVFGTMQAIAELALPINVVGIVPSAENMPDGQANKPGDVVTSMSGQTIEILNTDAEGRLILCDALTYAKRFKPKTVIDIATLTGAIIVALGHQTAGVMGNDQQVIDDLLQAGDTSLDFAWQLPLKKTYKNQLKSHFADLANIGTPGAGSITAGAFLSYFAEDFRWAHLDIAGTAWGGAAGKRASGRAVPILTQYLIDRC